MEQAQFTDTGQPVTARSLDRLIRADPSKRDTYRGNLVCLECGEAAAFCGRSKDGGVAHFRAIHLHGCSHKGREVGDTEGTLERNRPPLDNSGAELYLRFDPVSTTSGQGEVHVTGVDGQASSGGPSGRGAGGGPVLSQSKTSTNLKRLLVNLTANPEFVNGFEGRVVRVSESQLAPAVHWEDLVSSDRKFEGKSILLWGKIFSANMAADSSVYLNQGPVGENKAAIKLGAEAAQWILNDLHGLGLDSFWELREWHVIALGTAYPMQFGKMVGLKGEHGAIAFVPQP